MSQFVQGATAGAAIPDDVAVESGAPAVEGQPSPPPKPKPKGRALQAVGAGLEAADFSAPFQGSSEGTSAYTHKRPPLQDRIQQVSRDIWKQQEAG